MNKEVLVLAQSLANTRNISLDAIIEALEAALAAAARKHYAQSNNGEDIEIRVSIDPVTGEQSTFRRYHVIDDDNYEGEIILTVHLTLDEAREMKPDAEIGDIIEEAIETVETTGRKGAATAKGVIQQAIRIAERKKQVADYADKVNTLITGLVKKVSREFIVIDLGENVEAVMPREEMIPHETLRIGDRVRAYLYAANYEVRGAQLFVSRARSEMLVELFRLEVPEIGEDVITIKGAARDAGSRSKIAVKTNDGRIDPIGACVGMRGSRVQAVSRELGEERIDIILWDDNPAQLVINAMAPAEIESIVVDEDSHTIDLGVAEEYLSQAIGKNGQNVRLASELTGWTLNVLSTDDAKEKSENETKSSLEFFMEQLDIDEDIAAILVSEGFTTLEELAYIPMDELLEVEDFDEDIAEELQSRAKDGLLAKALTRADGEKPADDLLHMEGMTEELAYKLANAGIITMEDLAEQAVDDLLEIDGITDDLAAKLIMKAREPWFENNDE
ncbi:MAG: transcription termination/antitermination protein NusA [Legionellales bacterium]|nr:transcription termination/antitermination protein NusA [Legionellales bacterium]